MMAHGEKKPGKGKLKKKKGLPFKQQPKTKPSPAGQPCSQAQQPSPAAQLYGGKGGQGGQRGQRVRVQAPLRTTTPSPPYLQEPKSK